MTKKGLLLVSAYALSYNMDKDEEVRVGCGIKVLNDLPSPFIHVK